MALNGMVQIQIRVPVGVAEAMERVTGTRYGAKQAYLLKVITRDLQRRGELATDPTTPPLPLEADSRKV